MTLCLSEELLAASFMMNLPLAWRHRNLFLSAQQTCLLGILWRARIVTVGVTGADASIPTMYQKLPSALPSHLAPCLYRFGLGVEDLTRALAALTQGTPLRAALNDVNIVSVCHLQPPEY